MLQKCCYVKIKYQSIPRIISKFDKEVTLNEIELVQKMKLLNALKYDGKYVIFE